MPKNDLRVISKNRHQQDLNLRPQRGMDFKSIALDHSAMMSERLFVSLII